MNLYVGIKGQAQTIVKDSNTAKAMGSGQLEVFATPAMVALMEEAAVNSLELPLGQSSVGTSLDIKHIAATPLGSKVLATAELIEIDRRRLVFSVEVYDEAGQIGIGKHERFIIEVEPFLAKTKNRKQEL
ncbi:thioesterase family protein [Desulfosporosinus sp.]|uniref:thioesterase family protein n=1 Tax=Desulfosporosinus sp. TaxID=157907 RepID=UPI0025BF9C98|nr:thioesterase family protein [Desulfosporosinus sp.]MBC2722833.1 thioesterase family protein [Desulfosporosinus sp.]MBC2727644.1 thioesterase family protein [Desulfosporosinus sp.]